MKSDLVGLRSVIDWEACGLLEMAGLERGLLRPLAGGEVGTMASLVRFLRCGGLERFFGFSCFGDESTTPGLGSPAPETFDLDGV